MKFKHKLVQSNTPRELTYVGTSVMENEQVHENRKSKKDDGKIATVFRYYESRETTHYHVLPAVEIRCFCFDCTDTVARKCMVKLPKLVYITKTSVLGYIDAEKNIRNPAVPGNTNKIIDRWNCGG